jgi:hypothetical protein
MGPLGLRITPHTSLRLRLGVPRCASQHYWSADGRDGSSAAVIGVCALGLLHLSHPTLVVLIGTAGSCHRTNPLTRERAAREGRSKRQRMHVNR